MKNFRNKYRDKLNVVLVVILSLLCYFVLTYPANAQIFEDNFESGDFSNWTSTTIPSGATMEVNATAKKNGSYGQYVDLAGSSSGYHYALANKSYTHSGIETWFRGAVYFEDLTTINTSLTPTRGRIFFIQNSSSSSIQFSVNIYNSSGTYKMNAYIGSAKAYSTDITISLDTWYEIKVRCVNTASTGNDTLQLWVNTVSQGIKSCLALTDQDLDYLRCGFYPNQAIVTNATVYWDDVGVYTSDPGNFTSGWSHSFNGVSGADISEVNGVSISDISKIIDQ